jgi:hypothetical protein
LAAVYAVPRKFYRSSSGKGSFQIPSAVPHAFRSRFENNCQPHPSPKISFLFRCCSSVKIVIENATKSRYSEGRKPSGFPHLCTSSRLFKMTSNLKVF